MNRVPLFPHKRTSLWDEPPTPDPVAPDTFSWDEGINRKRGWRSYLALLRYAVPRWRGLGVVLASMLVMVGLDVIKPWPMKFLVDHVLKGNLRSADLSTWFEVLPGPTTRYWALFWVVVATVVIFVLATLFSMIYQVASVAIGQRMTYALGSDLFMHMQRMSLLFHARHPVGDSIHRVTGDTYCLQMMINGAVLPLLQSAITVVAMFVVMWNLDPLLTALSLGVVPFIILTIRRFKTPMYEFSRDQMDLEGSMMSVVERSLTAIPVVQAFNREDAEHERFRSFADRTTFAYVASTLTDMWFKLWAGLATTVGAAALIWAGAIAVFEGRLTLGSLLVFLAYLAALYGPLDQMTFTASTLQQAAAQADRVLDVLNAPIDVTERAGAKDIQLVGDVSYDNVSFSYEPGKPTLVDINLTMAVGQTVAIVGPTGAGKSTLVNLLVRYYDPDEGSIRIDGHDVRDLTLQSLRRQIAIVLQEPFIFPLSIADNIAYGRPGAARKDIVEAAKAAGAHEFIVKLPRGYDTIVGERGSTLSGGEKQRLSIARAFLKDAPILILDEPTSALDARTETALLAALKRLMVGRLTFVIAHRLSTIRDADLIVVLDNGRVVEKGTHDELLERGQLYSSLYHQQVRTAGITEDADASVLRLPAT